MAIKNIPIVVQLDYLALARIQDTSVGGSVFKVTLNVNWNEEKIIYVEKKK